MKHHFGGATVVTVVVVLLLLPCGGQQSGSGGGDSEFWGIAPQQPPRATTAQSSAVSSSSRLQPSEIFTPEQFEAASVLIEYYCIRNVVLSGLNADPQSLMDITIGQSWEVQANRLSELRGKGQAQAGTTVVHTAGAPEPVGFNGVRSMGVQIYTDVGEVNVIDSATGKSAMSVDRPRYLQWNVNVVKTEAG